VCFGNRGISSSLSFSLLWAPTPFWANSTKEMVS
jgi:hypothetical protein